jgi:bifunctional non-homologous end joining protein LigD
VPFTQITPRPLTRHKHPFTDPEWLFEIKWNGFRSLAYVERDRVRLVSRNGNEFKSFPDLCGGLADALRGRGTTILDGEIVCLDRQGRTQFRDLLFRRGTARFYAFDLLWLNGEELRLLPLIERKRRLRELVPLADMSLLYCDHLEADGIALFEQACRHDLEGIAAKRKHGAYLPGPESDWLKIRNRNYSQWIGREELFERERKSDPSSTLTFGVRAYSLAKLHLARPSGVHGLTLVSYPLSMSTKHTKSEKSARR